MKLEHVHLLPIVIAAFSTFLLGGLWYSPLLFGKAWLRENKFTAEDANRISKARAFGGSAVFALIMSANLAMFLADEKTTLAWGTAAGTLAGVGWVATAIAVIGLFENKSWTYIGINAGYQIVAFIIMGAILGGWR
ncbi:MAG: DUF1761 domain-containing protein [Verrucomicrobia bacterium]|nr:DUF1761 domain-containing protein [Verrucomicrobiota bacterium]